MFVSDMIRKVTVRLPAFEIPVCCFEEKLSFQIYEDYCIVYSVYLTCQTEYESPHAGLQETYFIYYSPPEPCVFIILFYSITV